MVDFLVERVNRLPVHDTLFRVFKQMIRTTGVDFIQNLLDPNRPVVRRNRLDNGVLHETFTNDNFLYSED